MQMVKIQITDRDERAKAFAAFPPRPSGLLSG
jgi:hypothetical protein